MFLRTHVRTCSGFYGISDDRFNFFLNHESSSLSFRSHFFLSSKFGLDSSKMWFHYTRQKRRSVFDHIFHLLSRQMDLISVYYSFRYFTSGKSSNDAYLLIFNLFFVAWFTSSQPTERYRQSIVIAKKW